MGQPPHEDSDGLLFQFTGGRGSQCVELQLVPHWILEGQGLSQGTSQASTRLTHVFYMQSCPGEWLTMKRL